MIGIVQSIANPDTENKFFLNLIFLPFPFSKRQKKKAHSY